MKYPRTYHFPWSPGATNDDKILSSVDSFLNKKLVILEKMDGSNTCMTNKECFSRSHASAPKHHSFNEFKALHASIKNQIEDNLLIYGEWLYAKHSLPYNSLPSYFLVFAIKNNTHWFSWPDVKKYSATLGLTTVPELATICVRNEDDLRKTAVQMSSGESIYGPEKEGSVTRLLDSFVDDEFSISVAKIVRSNHVQTDEHWMFSEIIKNGKKQ